ncbi:MAG: mitomycin resistance protein [Desulfonatronovibrio sp. MSAO_Bac4]|nr:MAG: mitomycin resistance protein [Desulfonatronovibrio sp. MSAO_Bac4]
MGLTIKKINKLEDLPNVGPAIAARLRVLGIDKPSDLPERDPYAMYDELNSITGQRHDPCLLDVFISVIRFMEGAPAKPWWKYTAQRKQRLGSVRNPVKSQTRIL